MEEGDGDEPEEEFDAASLGSLAASPHSLLSDSDDDENPIEVDSDDWSEFDPALSDLEDEKKDEPADEFDVEEDADEDATSGIFQVELMTEVGQRSAPQRTDVRRVP